MKTTQAASGDFCEDCGYPFDRGETVYLVYGDDELGPVACSKRCAESIRHRDRQREQRLARFARPHLARH